MKTNKLLKYIFFLILVVFPIGQIGRISLINIVPGLRIQLIDISVFLFGVIWAINKVKGKDKITLPEFSKELLIFTALALISILLQVFHLGLSEFFSSFLYFLRLANFVLFFFAFSDFLGKEKLPILTFLLAEGLIISFISLIQYIILPDTRFLLNFGWDEHYFRAIGTFLDPAFTGIILVLSFFVWLVKVLDSSKKNLLFIISGLIILLTIAFTFSRISYLSLLVGLLVAFIVNKKFGLVFFIFVIFSSIVILLPKPGGEGVNLLRISSFVARSDSYKKAIDIIEDHLLFGVGYNAYRFTQRDYGFISQTDWQDTNAGAGTDNSFLFVLATTGVFGLVSFAFFWFKIIYFCSKNLGKDPNSLLLFISMIGLTVSAFAVNSIFYPWIMLWFFILLSVFVTCKSKPTLTPSCSKQDQEKQS